jgi:hypothetical protein
MAGAQGLEPATWKRDVFVFMLVFFSIFALHSAWVMLRSTWLARWLAASGC